MIIRHHGGLELFAIIWMFLTLVAGSQNGTASTTGTLLTSNTSETIVVDNSTSIEVTTELEKQTALEDNITNPDKIEELVKAQRRAPRYDTADSVPWVRIYNRPPGVKTESYFKYDTRSNTSAHTSGEGWDSLRKDKPNEVAPINRRESKTRVQDLLRVKTKAVVTPSPKRQDTEETSASTNAPETTTNPPVQTSTAPALAKNDTQNKGYIIWSSKDGGPAGGWTFDDQKSKAGQKQPSVDDIMPKDGTKWKVIGEGGEDGWQVVDDKGDVEWKIEYDDGEWRVTSTGDVPVDTEWVDPEYVWEPAEASLSEEDEYNSWSADDYAYSPWVDPVVFVRGAANHTWPSSDVQTQIAKSSIQAFSSGEKKSNTIKDFLAPKEPFVFGARRKIPEKDTSSSQDRPTGGKSDLADDSLNKKDEPPQADQVVAKGKSWISTGPTIKTGQKWVQGYGVKSWEVDNTGKNAGFGGETWITENKDFSNSRWVPKQATGSIPESPKLVVPVVQPAPQNVQIPDNPIRAWGTGYGSKTWKGNEWDSNVVWKTGFGGALPWTPENSTSWKFPDDNSDDAKEKSKKSIVWSQPLPSEDSEPTSSPKPTNQPEKSLNNIRIKWPTKPPSGGNFKWKKPPRRAEDESWGDDSSEGGVIWKDQVTEAVPTDAPIDTSTKTIGPHLSKGWQTGGWITNQNIAAKPVSFSWKGNPPQKTSNLISVNWKSDEIVTDAPPAPAPVVWNQGQWPGGDPDSIPTWIFGGCKLTIKCGSSESDTSEDESAPTTPQDTSEDDSSSVATDAPTTTTAIKGWPVNQFKGKSWRPPTKSWKPPTKSWKPPKKNQEPSTPKQPPPTMPDTPPPTPPMNRKKPTPPSKTLWKKPPPGWKQPPPGWKQPFPGWKYPPPGWKQPPPGWKQPPPGWKQPPPGWNQPPPSWKQPPTPPPSTEDTTSVTPTMNWKSPPPSPPSMKWKKPGRRPTKSWKPPPTKSWKPPPTKSWKPPTYPGKGWQPSIATPAPDMLITPTKPDCKDNSETTQETPAPNIEDEDEAIIPPQIIIITKLPTNQKDTPPPSTDKWDTRDDRKKEKPPGKSWNFPSRKVSQKSNKNKKETMGRMVNKWPARPRKMSKPGNKFIGWPKGIPLPNFTWPANTRRRWTTKMPSYLSTWKPPKYMRSKAWKQMMKKWMKAQM